MQRGHSDDTVVWIETKNFFNKPVGIEGSESTGVITSLIKLLDDLLTAAAFHFEAYHRHSFSLICDLCTC